MVSKNPAPAHSLILAGLLLLTALGSGMSARAQQSRITRIDPPSWWTGMEHDTVQLLLCGENLFGAEPLFDPPGPLVLRSYPGATPDYLFVDVHIGADVEPGLYNLKLRSLRSEVSAPFPIEARAERSNRHQGFNPDDVIYLIVPDRFADGNPGNNEPGDPKLYLEYDRSQPGAWHGGDLQGIINRLGYLADLGITALWLTPMLENAGKGTYHGYAATDYYRVDPRFGTNALYAELVESAHALGIKVIFDHVNNHCGLEHPWVSKPPTQTWFNGSAAEHELDGHNLPAVHDPYAAPGDLDKMRRFWFVSQMPDINQRDPFAARYLIQQTLWWIEFAGLDGIREDTYPYFEPDYGVAWTRAILREYPGFNITGESWGTTAFTALFQKDCPLPRSFASELPSVIDFGLMMALERYLKGQDGLMAVYQRLAEDFLFADPDNLVTMISNHDTPRGIFLADGNTARYKVALHILLSTRGIPQLFYGEEIGLPGGESHVLLRQDFPGGFPGDTRNAFEQSGRTQAEQELFAFTRQALQLRQDYPALRRGTLRQLRPDWDGGYYAYARYHESGDVLSLVNGSDRPQRVPFGYIQPLLGKAGERGSAKPCRLRNLRSGQELLVQPGETLSLDAYQAEWYLILR